MIKALFFDIDGTLVSFNTHCIPQSTIEALTAAKANGVNIFISTGRPLPLVNNITPIRHLIDGYITTNGAYCLVKDKVVSCSPIAKDEVEAVIRYSHSMSFPVMVVGDKSLTMYNTASNPEAVRKTSELLNVPDIGRELPINDVLCQNILQLTPFIDEEQERNILSALDGIESGRWCDDFADFTAKGISKAKGLRDMAEYLDLNISETMAFGDGGNDLTIIKAAGIGVAMGNANEILKPAADYITTSVDDNGINNALRHWKVI